MAEQSQKKELRNLFKKLIDNEENIRRYLLEESSTLDFSSYFLADLTFDSVKAEVMSVRSANGSFAEAYTLDTIFKFDSIQRDLSIRSRRRSDYYRLAPQEYEKEAMRLNSVSSISIQTYSGNTKIQKG